jgi:hypothetical protein
MGRACVVCHIFLVAVNRVTAVRACSTFTRSRRGWPISPSCASDYSTGGLRRRLSDPHNQLGSFTFHFWNLEQYQRIKQGSPSLSNVRPEGRNLPALHARCVEQNFMFLTSSRYIAERGFPVRGSLLSPRERAEAFTRVSALERKASLSARNR